MSGPEKPYTGILLEPMQRSQKGGALPDIGWLHRLISLSEHYGVDMSDPQFGLDLAIALAMDHVPGFKFEGAPAGPQGRPASVSAGFRDLVLLGRVSAAIEGGGSVRAATTEIAEEWNRLGISNANGETLRQRYLRLKKDGVFTEGMKKAARVVLEMKL